MTFPQSAFFLIFLVFSLQSFASPDGDGNDHRLLTQNIRGELVEYIVDEAIENAASIQKIISLALALSGTPYHSGGTSPETGFDCSGFVRYVFNQAAHISLPPSAKNIAQTSAVIQKNALIPGDLVFFNTLKSTYSHVAIYLGDQTFIHAPSKGGVVRIDRMDAQYWARHFEGGRRVTVD
jgi:cell wall-associated NlpC family hydrolase